MALDVEASVIEQARRAIRAITSAPGSRARELAEIRDLEITGAVGALRARLYTPRSADNAPLLLFLHGGGFVVGDIDTHDALCSWLARSAGVRVLSSSYRLAPETRFPGQLDDARAAARWALENAAALGARGGQLAVGGDSAGAYLAARIAMELNAERPGSAPLQVLFYPLVHVQDSVWAEEELRNFRFLGRIAVSYIKRSLGADWPPSLLDFDLAKAPTTILAGGGPLDPVRADVKAFGEALQRAGVRVIERKYPQLAHGALNLTAMWPLARAALDEVGGLVRTELQL